VCARGSGGASLPPERVSLWDSGSCARDCVRRAGGNTVLWCIDVLWIL
jgi:hypothetical protein